MPGSRYKRKPRQKNKRSCSHGPGCVKCTWEARVKDKFLDKWVKSKPGTGRKSNQKDCKDSAKYWAGRMKSDYLKDLNSDLQAQYLDPINALFEGVLTSSDASNPCGA